MAIFRAQNDSHMIDRMFSATRTVLLTLVLLGVSIAYPAAGKDTAVIAVFDKPDSVQDWFSVNDSVMGGVSKGGFELTERKTLLFRGDLSLEKNGGFASIRTKPNALNLAGAKGISVKARGDGRTYCDMHSTGSPSSR